MILFNMQQSWYIVYSHLSQSSDLSSNTQIILMSKAYYKDVFPYSNPTILPRAASSRPLESSWISSVSSETDSLLTCPNEAVKPAC